VVVARLHEVMAQLYQVYCLPVCNALWFITMCQFIGEFYATGLTGKYCHVYRVCVCGSVTNNNTWIRIGYRIYSLWRFIAAADYNY
jgi:hypothetical protein